MIQLHTALKEHFKQNRILFRSHSDENGIDAAIPASLGNVPASFRHMEDKVAARCFSPLRIQPEHRAEVLELVHRLNDQMEPPQYGIDSRTNLAYCSLVMDVEDWSSGKDQVPHIIALGLILVARLFHAMTRVMYGGQKAAKVIKALEEEDEKSTKAPRVDPSNRIKGLTGGNPELN